MGGDDGGANILDEMDPEKLAMLRKCFAMFDNEKIGFINKDKIRTILNTLGATFLIDELNDRVNNNDVEGNGQLNFLSFVKVVSVYLEEQDEEAMQRELKEAFRLYDKEGNGFIPTSCLKEILAALDDKLSASDLDSIVDEIDEDGSGTVDFDEFMGMMTGD